MDIIIDSREQKPLWKKSTKTTQFEMKGLFIGDYSIKGYEDKIAIERKSPTDLFGTLGRGHKRFKKELEKSLKYKYFGIYIETSFGNILNKNFKHSHKSKMKGFVIIKILETIKLKYNIDVVFCNNRNEMRKRIKSVFNAYLNLKHK
tara:strand:+ start:735 stop:1175 length:441 start_codon:yes stop_codon:yes gene_type:complete